MVVKVLLIELVIYTLLAISAGVVWGLWQLRVISPIYWLSVIVDHSFTGKYVELRQGVEAVSENKFWGYVLRPPGCRLFWFYSPQTKHESFELMIEGDAFLVRNWKPHFLSHNTDVLSL